MSDINQVLDQRRGSVGAVMLLDRLEVKALGRIIDLIDGNHLDEARQVVQIIREVGII